MRIVFVFVMFIVIATLVITVPAVIIESFTGAGGLQCRPC
jgi:hypothetical protein